MIKTKLGMGADPGDIVTCAQFSLHWFDYLGSGTGQSCCFSYEDCTAHTIYSFHNRDMQPAASEDQHVCQFVWHAPMCNAVLDDSAFLCNRPYVGI
jgi:hypothetical protein